MPRRGRKTARPSRASASAGSRARAPRLPRTRCHAAAATGVIRPALETEDRHFDWTMSANARALISLSRAAAPAMAPGSSIVAVSSLGAQRVLDNYVLVGASKAALEAIVRYLAVELAPRGIRVNT